MNFLALGSTGKAGWIRYLLTMTFAFGFYFVVGILMYLAFLCIAIGKLPQFDDDGGVKNASQLIQFIALNLTFFPLVLAVFVGIKFIHARPFLSVLTASQRFRWSYAAIGFGLWAVLSSCTSLFEYLIAPSTFQWTFDAGKFWTQLPLILILTPIQTTAEELYFRGWLLQALSLITKRPIVLSSVIGVLFMLPHLMNPELAYSAILMPLMYFTIGFLLSIIAIRSNGLELGIGVHCANNIFCIVIAPQKSAIPANSILTCMEPNMLLSVIDLILCSVVFYFICKQLKLFAPGAANNNT